MTCQHARKFVNALEGLCEAYFTMGKSFVALARFDEKSGAHCGVYTETGRLAASQAVDMQKAGYATLKVHQIFKRFATLTAGRMATLHDQLNLVPSALVGLEDRERALAKVHQTEDTMERRRQKLDELTRDSAKVCGIRAVIDWQTMQADPGENENWWHCCIQQLELWV